MHETVAVVLLVLMAFSPWASPGGTAGEILEGEEEIRAVLLELITEVFSTSGSAATGMDAKSAAVMPNMKKGHRATVNFLIKQGASTNNLKDENGRSMLMLAAGDDIFNRNNRRLGKIDFANTNPRDLILNEWTNEDLVKILLKNGANVDEKDRKGRTALMFAASWGNEHIVKHLLANNASINLQDHNGITALNYGITKILLDWSTGRGKFIELLESRDRQPSIGGQSSLGQWLMKWDNSKAIQVLLEHNASVSIMNYMDYPPFYPPLAIAIAMAKLEQKDLEKVTEGVFHIMDMLLKKGASLDLKVGRSELTVFMMAVLNCPPNVIDFLLKYKPSLTAVDIHGNNVLLLTVMQYIDEDFFEQEESYIRVKQILDASDDELEINQKNDEGQTALLEALKEKCSWRLFELLVSHGADIHAVDNHGKTALMHASKPRIIDYLLEQGVSANAQDKNGTTALMYATSLYCDEVMAKHLIQQNSVDVNIQDNGGRTALIRLFSENPGCRHPYGGQYQYRTLLALLRNGAIPTIRDAEGNHVLDYVRRRHLQDKVEIEKFLEPFFN